MRTRKCRLTRRVQAFVCARLLLIENMTQRQAAEYLSVDQAEVPRMLRRYCLNANPVAYARLSFRASGSARASGPTLLCLRTSAHEFLPYRAWHGGLSDFEIDLAKQLEHVAKEVTVPVTRHLFLTGETFCPEIGVGEGSS